MAKKNTLLDTPDKNSKDRNTKNTTVTIYPSLIKKSSKNEHENSPTIRPKNLMEICENVNAEDEETNEPR